MSFDLQRILESKAAHRGKLADLPIGEKLRLLDEMRARALAIQQARPAEESVLREEPATYRYTPRLPTDHGSRITDHGSLITDH